MGRSIQCCLTVPKISSDPLVFLRIIVVIPKAQKLKFQNCENFCYGFLEMHPAGEILMHFHRRRDFTSFESRSYSCFYEALDIWKLL